MESKKINQLATELAPDLSDITIIGDPTTGISKKITLSQMASLFTGTVEEYATLAAFPLVGVADTIYIALDTNVIYRYDTSLSAYVILSPNIINSLVFSDANGFDGTITLVGSVATLSITTALTLGSVPFIGASGALTQDNANLFFDDTNNRLGIATASPTTPLDVFGSGIIGRFNATSTNNAYLGFASNGTNKWSAGNVQSDHRFRIFSEANSAELITILQTGEFGIGISNPTTKFHIDGGATALIANLDANVSVAKSISFRSDNSARINLEVSGTESGSNAGADFFLRTYTDAGSLLETPFTIVRSTGVTTIKSLTLTNALSVANGGTGTTSFTSGSILFSNGSSITQDNSNLFWDNTNKRLGIGITSPSAFFQISTGSAGQSTPNIRLTDSSISGNGGNTYISADKPGVGYNNLTLLAFSYTFKGGGSASDFLIINSTGNIGINVTPSDGWVNGKALEVGFAGSAVWGRYSNEFHLTNNYYFSTSTNSRLYASTAPASDYEQYNGGHTWYTAPSGTINTAVTFTARMAIANNGNILIGTTTDGGYKLLVVGTTYVNGSFLADSMRTLEGTVSNPYNVWTTMFTVSTNTVAIYYVIAVSQGNGLTYTTSAMVVVNDGGVGLHNYVPAGALTLQTSGYDVQVKNGSGSTMVIKYKFIKMA